MKTFALVLVAFTILLSLAACSKEGPAPITQDEIQQLRNPQREPPPEAMGAMQRAMSGEGN